MNTILLVFNLLITPADVCSHERAQVYNVGISELKSTREPVLIDGVKYKEVVLSGDEFFIAGKQFSSFSRYKKIHKRLRKTYGVPLKEDADVTIWTSGNNLLVKSHHDKKSVEARYYCEDD